MKEHVILSLLNGAAPEDLAKSLGDMGSLEYVQDFQNMMLLEFDREFSGGPDSIFWKICAKK